MVCCDQGKAPWSIPHLVSIHLEATICTDWFTLMCYRNFAASQTQCVKGAVYQRYGSKSEAMAAYDTATAQGVVEYL